MCWSFLGLTSLFIATRFTFTLEAFRNALSLYPQLLINSYVIGFIVFWVLGARLVHVTEKQVVELVRYDVFQNPTWLNRFRLNPWLDNIHLLLGILQTNTCYHI